MYCRIHVRRTDKRTEAKYHDIEEYMEHVSYTKSIYNKILIIMLV